MVVITCCTLICFWFQILCSVNSVSLTLFNGITYFASFCLKKIEKNNHSKTSNQKFFFWIIVTGRTCWEQVLWIEWTYTKNFRRCNTNFWCNQAKLFYLSTHIYRPRMKKMSMLRVPLCLRLHIKSRLSLSRWAK